MLYDINPRTAKSGLFLPTRKKNHFSPQVGFLGRKLRLEDPLLCQLLTTKIKFVGATVILFKYYKRFLVAISIIKVILFLWPP